VASGNLFLAWRGTQHDGHLFVPAAVEAGAAAAVVERELPGVDVPQLVVGDGRRAAALAADVMAGSPASKVDVVAVTGTNGKTTTALVARHLLAALPGGAGALGTLGLVEADGRVRPGTEGLTTPDPVRLAVWLRELVDAGVRTVALEASSHALDQRRLDALRPRVAVFTNFSRDHLDYHGSVEAYHAAKLRLLSLLRNGGAAVVNAADPAWAGIQAANLLTYAVQAEADLRAENLVLSPSGTRFTLHFRGQSAPVALPLVGAFNVENALAATGAALLMGLSLPEVAALLESAPRVPGRMEPVVTGPFTVLIDFAHTPDALENLLEAVRGLAAGRLLVLFGAGGDRDRGKRRPMAEAVARWADRVYLTSDNPRTEHPDRILDDLEAGLGAVPRVREADRREAILTAVSDSADGDVLVLAGKGHETCQVVGTEKLPFDERDVVAEAMRLRGAA
jgi:UDP-N-acetylmuramoyl-L-alanyl-D-glutamate--2,6-diaminopimelate ligase